MYKSRKHRMQRKNRRASRKRMGGANGPALLTLDDLNESNNSIIPNNSNVSMNNISVETPDLDVTPPPLTMDDLNVENMSNSGYTTVETNNSGISDISGTPNISGTPDFMNTSMSTIGQEEETINFNDLTNPLTQETYGGKRTNKRKSRKSSKRKSRKSSKRKSRTNKRKSRTSKRKSRTNKRKSRKSRQYGGTSFTTQEETNPIQYKDDEYDQLKNALNY